MSQDQTNFADEAQTGGAVTPLAPLDRIFSLLGADAFLVPCIWGTKMPAVTQIESKPP